jgi:hypothetical protein
MGGSHLKKVSENETRMYTLCTINGKELDTGHMKIFLASSAKVILKSRTLSRTSDTTETRNPCVIKVILLACFTYIDIF